MIGRIKRAVVTSATAMLAATMMGTRAVFPNQSPKVPLPPHIAGMGRRARKRATDKAWTRQEQRNNQRRNRAERRRGVKAKGEEHQEQQAIINNMTNWQRNQWAKAAVDGKRPHALGELKRFANMPHWKVVT